jgi:hypothetical protein
MEKEKEKEEEKKKKEKNKTPASSSHISADIRPDRSLRNVTRLPISSFPNNANIWLHIILATGRSAKEIKNE